MSRHATRVRRPVPRWLIAMGSVLVLVLVGSWAQALNREGAEEESSAATTTATAPAAEDDTLTVEGDLDQGTAEQATSTVDDVNCTFPTDQAQTAADLQSALRAAVQAKSASVAVSVYDEGTGVWCSYQGSVHFDGTAVARATTLAALLYQAQTEGRTLTATEKGWAELAVVEGDADAAQQLWDAVGTSGMTTFLDAAGMTQTALDEDGRWELMQVTARDQVNLLKALTGDGVLVQKKRGYEQDLLVQAAAGLERGLGVGAPDGTEVGALNGALERESKGWRTSSIGVVTGGGRQYVLAAMCDTNATEAAGWERLGKVAKAIHGVLG